MTTHSVDWDCSASWFAPEEEGDFYFTNWDGGYPFQIKNPNWLKSGMLESTSNCIQMPKGDEGLQ